MSLFFSIVVCLELIYKWHNKGNKFILNESYPYTIEMEKWKNFHLILCHFFFKWENKPTKADSKSKEGKNAILRCHHTSDVPEATGAHRIRPVHPPALTIPPQGRVHKEAGDLVLPVPSPVDFLLWSVVSYNLQLFPSNHKMSEQFITKLPLQTLMKILTSIY